MTPIFTRRNFTKTALLGAMAPTVLSASLTNDQSKDRPLRIGLVGAGARGLGALRDIFTIDQNVELWAIGDIFPDHLKRAKRVLQRRYRKQTRNAFERAYLGFNAYQQVIDSGVDIVFLCTPPVFRPLHLSYAVKQSKHIFAEKPLAIDPQGLQAVEQAAEEAKKKNLTLISGLVYRYEKSIQEAQRLIADGKLGEVLSAYSSFYSWQVRALPSEKPENLSQLEWAMRYWHNFREISGDSYLEQVIHSIDKLLWSCGDTMPESCLATGGRQVPMLGSNIYDHFSVNYNFGKGLRAQISTRQMNQTHNEILDSVRGSKGYAELPRLVVDEKEVYQKNINLAEAYKEQHRSLLKSLRADKGRNDLQSFAIKSHKMALMGRLAAYTGQEVTWQDVLDAEQVIWDPQTAKDFQSEFNPKPMPIPGQSV